MKAVEERKRRTMQTAEDENESRQGKRVTRLGESLAAVGSWSGLIEE
jgi:hypothetical protein